MEALEPLAVELQNLASRIALLPRTRLAHLPTPLEELPRLSAQLGGPRIFIKRDDCTGLAFGGNKTRHNEFILGGALRDGVDALVWGAGIQSNNCRQTAAAAARLGLHCDLTLSTNGHAVELQGNLLLDYLLGATVQLTDVPIGEELWSLIRHRAERLRAEGRSVLSIVDASARAAAACSYTLCAVELIEQFEHQRLNPAAIYFCSAGSTGAGLFLAQSLLGIAASLIGIMPIQWPFDVSKYIADMANDAADLLGSPRCVRPADICVTGDYIGQGYGIPTPEGMEATRLLAQREGILLDPVYTAKAMAALIADIRAGRWSKDQTVVFIHTGGTPALFAYHRELAKEFAG